MWLDAIKKDIRVMYLTIELTLNRAECVQPQTFGIKTILVLTIEVKLTE